MPSLSLIYCNRLITFWLMDRMRETSLESDTFFYHQGVNDAKMKKSFQSHSCFDLSPEKLKNLEERNLIAHNTFAKKNAQTRVSQTPTLSVNFFVELVDHQGKQQLKWFPPKSVSFYIYPTCRVIKRTDISSMSSVAFVDSASHGMDASIISMDCMAWNHCPPEEQKELRRCQMQMVWSTAVSLSSFNFFLSSLFC